MLSWYQKERLNQLVVTTLREIHRQQLILNYGFALTIILVYFVPLPKTSFITWLQLNTPFQQTMKVTKSRFHYKLFQNKVKKSFWPQHHVGDLPASYFCSATVTQVKAKMYQSPETKVKCKALSHGHILLLKRLSYGEQQHWYKQQHHKKSRTKICVHGNDLGMMQWDCSWGIKCSTPTPNPCSISYVWFFPHAKKFQQFFRAVYLF